jgi:lysozyme
MLDGSAVTGATKPITEAMADQLFDRAMALIQPKLEQMLEIAVSAQEGGALLSMQYNIGSNALAGSNVIRLLNQGDRVGAANAMLDWDHTGQDVSEGLLRRRTAERAVFLGLVNPLQPNASAIPAPLTRPIPIASAAQSPADTTDALNNAQLASITEET